MDKEEKIGLIIPSIFIFLMLSFVGYTTILNDLRPSPYSIPLRYDHPQFEEKYVEYCEDREIYNKWDIFGDIGNSKYGDAMNCDWWLNEYKYEN